MVNTGIEAFGNIYGAIDNTKGYSQRTYSGKDLPEWMTKNKYMKTLNYLLFFGSYIGIIGFFMEYNNS